MNHPRGGFAAPDQEGDAGRAAELDPQRLLGRAGALFVLIVAGIAQASMPVRAQPHAGATSAADAAAPGTIVQQRLPDGRIVFTDRPVPGAKTERSWTHAPEDPATAEARRAAALRESAAVSERIARQLEQQREIDADLQRDRERRAEARAERDAARERARADEAPPAVVVLPPYARRPPAWQAPPPRPPIAQPVRPGPFVPPRPGATPPPRPNGAPPEQLLPVYPR